MRFIERPVHIIRRKAGNLMHMHMHMHVLILRREKMAGEIARAAALIAD
ncbi:hypothetical protein PB2503_06127 [Parvularcula bermudensis HTCC2503]|uniref:Uncharacterized protein n=1 Tax=Parvularcula bermudensis (strain ATCC BAA-594 / HTCC2503 / KCTC 12087) TaxID=314260 RepID=E0THJ7_PARBH|nr:hypothetical protein [Parvularcula bermudensis]ADM09293.1 hypothetical protein PB2503_06127 [Parvularcula bermudensis HTCC2503]